MKVLDLQCSGSHVFEGWFASEDDFASQLARGLVSCPMCADTRVSKKLSAPRLNLGHGRAPDAPAHDVLATNPETEVQLAWMALARRVLANTDDVGARFAEEARHNAASAARPRRPRPSPCWTKALP